MKYIMVLLMSVGICTFSMAQDYNMDNDKASSSDAKAPMNNSSMNNDVNNSSMNKEVSTSSTTVTAPQVNQVTTVNKTEDRESVAGILWRSPFRIVGYTVGGVAKGVGSVGKGVGKIAIAPFRAIGKAFFGHHKGNGNEVKTETTTTSTQPASVVESNSTMSKEYRENM